ncbi:leukocyte elastase inhibitor-like [Engraulis encrasicolus]|uniref:leukocyte elastase inhibitor-like n=1 Tax=Engraulis encrasicolus TaxID=184585 RepID=UPI002FCF0920
MSIIQLFYLQTLSHSMASMAAANTNFSLELYKKIAASNKTGNVFFSPFSISSALAMVYLGAKGNTSTQMHAVLSLDKAEGDVHVGFNKLLAEFRPKACDPYVLSMANRLYGEQSYQFVEKFLADTKLYYLTELEPIDFKANAEAARVKINKWVEGETQEKIKDLLAKGTVNRATQLVLVSAIYFIACWESQFRRADTKEVPFRLNKKETRPVQMMHQMEHFPFTRIPDVNCKILELPYKGKDLSMLVMLPNEMEDGTTGLEKLEQALTYDNFINWTKPHMMNTVKVNVGLPKFKLEETYDLKKTLVSMGMADAFDPNKCDFSGMSPDQELVLSEVVHKSFVEVNEEYTEAAAATAMAMITGCLMTTREDPEEFMADHPFLFFIRHNLTQSILFYGRYSSP